MVTTVGSGSMTYELAEGWAKLPQGWSFHEVAAVGNDSRDNVYVFGRGEHPMMIFDREGNFLSSWGEGEFTRPHGLTMGPDDSVWLTDDGDHTIRKFTLSGKLLMTLGTRGQASPYQGGTPFNRPTHAAISPITGDIYVSDGYGNSRVHKYAPNGRYLFSWGEPGIDEGQFNIPHNICTDKEGLVYVADRENHRVQIFDPNGRFLDMWNNIHRPCGLYANLEGDGHFYIGELGPGMSVNRRCPNLGHRVSIFNREGKLVTRFGDPEEGEGPGQFIAPHGICVDSCGDIYVGEVSWTILGQYLDPPRELRSLQKFVRKPQ